MQVAPRSCSPHVETTPFVIWIEIEIAPGLRRHVCDQGHLVGFAALHAMDRVDRYAGLVCQTRATSLNCHIVHSLVEGDPFQDLVPHAVT